MVVTVKDIVYGNGEIEPVIIQDEYGECLYDGWLRDVPKELYGRVVESTGWLMVARKHLIKVEAEPEGEFTTRTIAPDWSTPMTTVYFSLKTDGWKQLERTEEWRAFLKLLGKAQRE
jgi:hypothetical protein